MNKGILGFVGLGNMGRPMATRLLNAGWDVIVYDLDEAAVQALVQGGAQPAQSVVDVANKASTVLLSLPNPAIVQTVAQELATGKLSKRVVDFSTIGPGAAVKVAEILGKNDCTYIDCPVSGGVPGATAGTLALMVSCPTALHEQLLPLLQILGKPIHVGEKPGQAQTAKLANNLLSAAAIAISSEAMAMAVKGGLDPRVMLEVINAGSGRNSATQDKFPRSILPGTFDYGFGTGLAYKDVRLCIDEAEQLGVPMVVGAAVREMLAITNSVYGADSDYTSICRVVESWAGVEIRG